MPRTVWISNLQEGQSVRLPAQVIAADMKAKKDGSPYVTLTLADRTGRITANAWDLPGAECTRIRAYHFAEFCGLVVDYRGRLQLNVAGAPRDLGVPDDLSDYLVCSPLPLAALRARLSQHIESVSNTHLHDLLCELFERDAALAARFMEYPAAQTMHHAFRHGLLHHTMEVADLTTAMAERQSAWGWRAVNRDLAVTGALLHDIGKTQELETSSYRYNYSTPGELLGHITLGLLIVARAVAKVRRRGDFPDDLEQMLLHLISSHHGKGEWGSPAPPKTAEALLVHMADRTSAELYYFNEAGALAADGDQFAKQSKLDDGFGRIGRRVFVGEMPGRPAAPLQVQEEAAPYAAIPRAAGLPILRMVVINEDGEAVAGMRVLPLVGRVAAGTRVLDAENVEGRLLVDTDRLTADRHYLLRVTGDSMIGDGIEDGDLVVVREAAAADAHAIVVAQVPGGGAVVKRLRTTPGGIALISSNPAYPPASVPDPEQLRIQGVVIGIARR